MIFSVYKSAQTSHKGDYGKALNVGGNAVRAQASRVTFLEGISRNLAVIKLVITILIYNFVWSKKVKQR